MESVLTLSDATARFSEIVEKVVNGDEFITAVHSIDCWSPRHGLAG